VRIQPDDLWLWFFGHHADAGDVRSALLAACMPTRA
jgi:hypothetical protein